MWRDERFTKVKGTVGELFRFVLIGVLNFLVDTAIYLLLSGPAGLSTVLAKTVSYPCGVVNSFFFNSRFTFKVKMRFLSWDFAKFVVVNLISYGVSVLAIYILTDLYGVGKLLSQIIATAFSFTVNYAGNKFIVFAGKQNEAKAKQTEDSDIKEKED